MSDVEGTFGADGGFVGRGEQGALFDSGDASDSPNLGYRGATACAAAGITYRQLDYWARTGLLVPSIRSATGSGSGPVIAATSASIRSSHCCMGTG